MRTYPDLNDLVPLGLGCRESLDLPTFPVFWHETILEQPSWEDDAREVPTNVVPASDDDWLFKSEYLSDRYYGLCDTCPIKLGGWPSWIQGASWPKAAQFALEVNSTAKGKLSFSDAGSIYIFKTSDSWEIRGDCY